MKKLICLLLLFIALGVGIAMAGTQIIHYCPKCGSTDVVIEAEQTEPEFIRESLDEWKDKPWVTTSDLTIRYTKFIGICKKCGYRVEKFYPF